MVLKPKNLKLSKSLKKEIKHILVDNDWEIRVDDDFHATILACAKQPRKGQNGTWITHAIMHAYGELHEQGFAHSVEVFFKGKGLVVSIALISAQLSLVSLCSLIRKMHPN